MRTIIVGFLVFVFIWPGARPGWSHGAGSQRPYHGVVQKIASKYEIDADLIHAVIKAESNYNRFALSDKGAIGLMQLMPSTAKLYGVNNVLDPGQNIEGGTKYLKDLIKLYNGRRDLVLAAYNAGQEAVKKYGGKIPPYPETRNYIKRIQAIYKKPIIRTRTTIYKYYDSEGRFVMTNDPNLYLTDRAR